MHGRADAVLRPTTQPGLALHMKSAVQWAPHKKLQARMLRLNWPARRRAPAMGTAVKSEKRPKFNIS